MSIPMVLAPVFVLIALTFALNFWMACLRVAPFPAAPSTRATSPCGSRIGRRARRRSATPITTSSSIRCCSMCWSRSRLITRQADFLFVVMSWLFVVFRLLHAYVFVTSNRVSRRFWAFFASSVVLLLMWIIFAAQILFAI